MNLTQKLRKQLHQSGEQMLGKCGLQFEFRYLKGLKIPPKSYILRGSAVDAGVDVDLTHKINTGELEPDIKVLTDVARDAIEHHKERDNIEPDKDEEGMSKADIIGLAKDTAVRLVTAHHTVVAPEIHPKQVHRNFSLNMDRWLRGKAKEIHLRAEQAENAWLRRTLTMQGRYLNAAAREGFDFVGEFDVDEEFENESKQIVTRIRDTKTSKKSPDGSPDKDGKQKEGPNAADKSHQLTFYALAKKVLDGKMPDVLMLDYLVALEKSTKAVTLQTTRDEVECNASLNRIVHAIVSIRSGVFVPAPATAWWCSAKMCGYHHICPAVKHTVTSLPAKLVQIKIDETTPMGEAEEES